MNASAPPIMNLPNILTLSRLGLSFVLFWFIHVELWVLALTVFCIAAITDWLDGYLARKQGLTSAFGRNLDPLVDKLLICGVFIFLMPVMLADLRPWMVMLVVGRELVVTGLRSFFEARKVSFGAEFLGKIKMVLQCAWVIATLLALSLPTEHQHSISSIQSGLLWAMLAATALSGLQYIVRAVTLMQGNKQ